MAAAQLLDTLLQKKWLSSNSVRDGLIACFTLTLLNLSQHIPLSRLGLKSDTAASDRPDEGDIHQHVLQAARSAFEALQVFEEYPSKEHLIRLRAEMEERLGFAQLGEEASAFMTEHNHRAALLLDKME